MLPYIVHTVKRIILRESKVLTVEISKEALRGMDAAGLYTVAETLRRRIATVVPDTGGHLASNLGAVELTVALHSVLDTPQDKLIFDVGHQSYAHKLLTGRAEGFHTLRSEGGISGFPRMSESEHDAFGAGHASTAISAALGYARARDIRGEDYTVAVVVGDGALTGGQCYEALNDAGQSKTPLIIVLNDNGMSISRNVGALTLHLSRLRAGSRYQSAKSVVQRIIRRMPVGKTFLEQSALRIKNSIKYLFTNGAFFDSLGIQYLGPVDGHDIAALKAIMERAKLLKWPVVIHAVTTKGKGETHAESHPSRFHNLAPRKQPSDAQSLDAVAGKSLVEMAEGDRRVAAITAAMPGGTGLDVFKQRVPERFFDVGITEPHAVTFACGLAAGGLRPFVALYSTFWPRALDHAMQDAALQALPVTMLVARAGICGEDGVTHQGLYDMAFFNAVPGLCVMAARDGVMLEAILRFSLDCGKPLAVRYAKAARVLPYPVPGIAPGRWQTLREGADIAIIAIGGMVEKALAAADMLAECGVEAAVIDAYSVKPLDERFLLTDTHPLLTAEDAALSGGLGAAVARFMADNGIMRPMATVGAPDIPIEHGDADAVMEALGMSARGIYERARALLGDRP